MGYLCVYAVLLETTSRVFASPVSAQTLDAQGSRNFDGLDGMLERVNSISLGLDEEDFLPLAVLVGEPAARNFDVLDGILVRDSSVNLHLEEEDFLPLAVLVSEPADVTKPSSAGGDTEPIRAVYTS